MPTISTRQAVRILALLYLTVGIFVGFLLQAPLGASAPLCWPTVSVFGVLETACDNPIMTVIWAATVGLPRLVIILPALALAGLTTELRQSYTVMRIFYSVTPWLVFLTFSVFAIWFASAYRRGHTLPIEPFLLSVLFLEVAYFAIDM